MRYSANKYSRGTCCENGLFNNLGECMEFARDGLCDYVLAYDNDEGITYKIRFDGHVVECVRAR